MKTTRSLAGILLGIALAANAAPLKTDLAHSSVSAVFKQMDVPVESSFKRFDARVDYDAAHPDKASARVDIDTASFDMGQADYNKEIAKKEWFNSAQFPKASFVSSSIKPAGAGKLTVTGKLTIKGLDILNEPYIRKLWKLNAGESYKEAYPDQFLAMLQAEDYFDNLARTGAEADIHEDTHTVDVTLTFVGGKLVPDNQRGRRR